MCALLQVWRARQDVLGLQDTWRPQSSCFEFEMRETVVREASEAVRHKHICADYGVRLLARAASLPAVRLRQRVRGSAAEIRRHTGSSFSGYRPRRGDAVYRRE